MDLSEWTHDRRLSVSVYMFTASLVAQLVKNLPLQKCSQKIFMKKMFTKKIQKDVHTKKMLLLQRNTQ